MATENALYHPTDNPPTLAVVVAYHPAPEQLQQLLATLLRENLPVLVCDNGGTEWIPQWVAAHKPMPTCAAPPAGSAAVTYLPMGSNQGVGAALNKGIYWALSNRFAQVITFDHDSLPPPGSLAVLIQTLAKAPPQVAAVAPMIRDRRTGHLGPLVGEITRWGRRPKHYLRPGATAWLDHAITSGMTIRLTAWQTIGPFREDYFIDYIDIEWSLRARRAGYRILGTGDAELLHDLGERWIILPGGHRVAVHRPERAYYEIRNGICTHRCSTEWRWRVWHWWIGIKKILFYLLFLPERHRRLRALVMGIKDALAKK